MDPLTIIAAINGLEALANVVNKQVALAKQSGELTFEQEQAIDAARAKTYLAAHWQPSQP